MAIINVEYTELFITLKMDSFGSVLNIVEKKFKNLYKQRKPKSKYFQQQLTSPFTARIIIVQGKPFLTR